MIFKYFTNPKLYSTMSKLTKCTLVCVSHNFNPIPLPHDVEIIAGRSRETQIKTTSVSRKQVKLIANTDLYAVKVIPIGLNLSGVNGFLLKQNKEYVLHHKDRLEFVLNDCIYEVIFEPEPGVDNDKKRKSESIDANDTGVSKKLKVIEDINELEVGWEGIDNDRMFVYTSIGLKSREKIAAYDLDGTLIKTKSGARFPKDTDDWTFLYPQVKKKLHELHENDYKIVIFTNQAGIGMGRVKIADFKPKIENIITKLDIPVQAFVSTGKGVYRKPAPGMWDILSEQKNQGIEINLRESFYCGDAAGRDKNWAPKMKKDHSISDLLFALNIGIDFKTPQEHFLGAKKVAHLMPEFDPRKDHDGALLEPDSSQLCSSTQEVIIFVGSPGSGKSHICKFLLVPEGYIHVNRDTLGTWQKCVAALETAIAKKQSVVIDNTNPDVQSRKRYIDVAKKYKIPCRCFVMNTTLKQAKHNNLFREMTDRKHQIVNDIIINSYNKNFVPPELKEGFLEIVKVNCKPKFDDPKHDRLYHMFLLEK